MRERWRAAWRIERRLALYNGRKPCCYIACKALFGRYCVPRRDTIFAYLNYAAHARWMGRIKDARWFLEESRDA